MRDRTVLAIARSFRWSATAPGSGLQLAGADRPYGLADTFRRSDKNWHADAARGTAPVPDVCLHVSCTMLRHTCSRRDFRASGPGGERRWPETTGVPKRRRSSSSGSSSRRPWSTRRSRTSAFTEYYLVNLLAALRARRRAARAASRATTRCRWPCSTCARWRPRATSARGCCARWATPRCSCPASSPTASTRKLADLGYYRRMGGQAYARLSQEDGCAARSSRSVFAELAGRFTQFADVLSEVSETQPPRPATARCSQLYERWLQTGSRRAAALLAEQRHHAGGRPATAACSERSRAPRPAAGRRAAPAGGALRARAAGRRSPTS